MTRRRRRSIFDVRVAGFGGQGVLLLGEVLAEAGLDAGLEVSWLPSYGPEMRSGTSNCHVRLSSQPIDSPLVTAPNVLVAMNEPSLRKFDQERARRADGLSTTAMSFRPIASATACMCWRSFHAIGRRAGRHAGRNMVMLGALLEIAGVLPQAASTRLCGGW